MLAVNRLQQCTVKLSETCFVIGYHWLVVRAHDMTVAELNHAAMVEMWIECISVQETVCDMFNGEFE